MFGRKRPSRPTQLVQSVAGISDRVGDRLPNKLDSYAAGAVALGMGNWLTTSLFNFDAVQAVAGKRKLSGRAVYGLIGLSAVYATLRGSRKAT